MFFTVPSEIIKCVQQLEHKKVITFADTCKAIHNQHGIIGFMRGYCVTFNRDVWGFALYFWSYFYLKDLGERKNINSNLYLLLIGGFAGIFYINN